MLRKVHRLYMHSTINDHKKIPCIKPSLLSRHRKITEAPSLESPLNYLPSIFPKGNQLSAVLIS